MGGDYAMFMIRVAPGVLRINIADSRACLTAIGPSCKNPDAAWDEAKCHVRRHVGHPHLIALVGFIPDSSLVWSDSPKALVQTAGLRRALVTAVRGN